ncbi:MAG TPA: hypothetical protein VIG47_13265, partial [Gemmatimonadaceae bacterium]|jgi:hypothetical protein
VAVSSFTQISVDSRKEKREREREVSRSEEDLRLSVRLVSYELGGAEERLREAASSGAYWSSDHQLSTQSWAEHRTTLAARLSGPADWNCVVEAYQEIDRINRVVGERRRQRYGGEVSVEDDDTLTSWRIIMYAIGVLDATVHDWYGTDSWVAHQAGLERIHWDIEQR